MTATALYQQNVSLPHGNGRGADMTQLSPRASINISGRAVREEVPNRKTCNLVTIVVIGIFFLGCFGIGAGAYLFFDSSRKLIIISNDPEAQSEFYLGMVLLALSFFAIFKTTVAREFTDRSETNQVESAV